MTTTNRNFISFGLTSIIVLDLFSSMPLSRWYSVLSHLRHKVGSTSTHKLEVYSVKRVLGMIQDDERK